MKLYDGYRELMIDIVRRAQEKNLCSRDIAPEAAAGFMVSALNGSLIGFLIAGGTPTNWDGRSRCSRNGCSAIPHNARLRAARPSLNQAFQEDLEKPFRCEYR